MSASLGFLFFCAWNYELKKNDFEPNIWCANQNLKLRMIPYFLFFQIQLFRNFVDCVASGHLWKCEEKLTRTLSTLNKKKRKKIQCFRNGHRVLSRKGKTNSHLLKPVWLVLSQCQFSISAFLSDLAKLVSVVVGKILSFLWLMNNNEAFR